MCIDWGSYGEGALPKAGQGSQWRGGWHRSPGPDLQVEARRALGSSSRCGERLRSGETGAAWGETRALG